MRVISGTARGLRLKSPDGVDTRPTLDRVKEAVFSMLCTEILNADVLDLFSGTGALGIEALSRGAKSAVMVDSSQKATNCIKENLSAARLSENAHVVKSDFVTYAENCKKDFDLIFLDPPYSKNFYEKALMLIAKHKLLRENGLIVAEWDGEVGFTEEFFAFRVLKEKRYGRVCITVLK